MSNDYLEVYLEECKKQIEKIGSNIKCNDRSIEAMNSINSIYQYLKEIADKFYDKETDTMHIFYNSLVWDVYYIRNKISSSCYIMPTNEFYRYNENFDYENNINSQDETKKLDFIVHKTYNIYQKKYILFYPKDFRTLDLINSCYDISEIVKKLC